MPAARSEPRVRNSTTRATSTPMPSTRLRPGRLSLYASPPIEACRARDAVLQRDPSRSPGPRRCRGAIPAASVSSLIITIAARLVVGDHALGVLVERRGDLVHALERGEAVDARLDGGCGSRGRVRTLARRRDDDNCAVVPLAWGKVRPSESSAVCDSVPGSVNSSSNSPPISAAAPPSTSSAVSQASRTASRRRYAARPSAVQERRHVTPTAGWIHDCIRYIPVSGSTVRRRGGEMTHMLGVEAVPVTARRAQTRERLLAAAASVFAERGIIGASASRRSARRPASPAAPSTPTSPTRTSWCSR